MAQLTADAALRERLKEMEAQVVSGDISPAAAAMQVLAKPL
jgi:hypothetical protein